VIRQLCPLPTCSIPPDVRRGGSRGVSSTAYKLLRQRLFENFDDEVREKLKVRNADTNLHLNRFEQQLMRLAKHELDGTAAFLNSAARNLA
jgi:hypothetical protein